MKKRIFSCFIAVVMIVALALPTAAISSKQLYEDYDAYIVVVGESSAVVSRAVFLQICNEIDKEVFDAQAFVRSAPRNTSKAGGTTSYKPTSTSGFQINGDGVITVTFNFATTPKSTSMFSKKYPSGAESNKASITTASFTAPIVIVGTGEYSVNVHNGNSAGLVMNSGTIEVTT